MDLRVGIVGLGAMGGAISANLVERGFAVTGFDLDPSRVEQLVDAGGSAADSPAAVARDSDLVLLSLPSAAAFEAVAVRSDGLAAGAHDGLIVADTSTLPIAVKEQGRAALARHAVILLDCPLSGTGDQAVTRDVIVLASGDSAAVQRCTPVFEGFARAHHHLGGFGAGSKMKFVANLLVAIHNVAAAEAMNLAQAGGLDPRQTLEVISDGAGTSRMFEIRAPKMIERTYRPGVRTRVFQKDLAAIEDFARARDAAVPLLALVSQFYVAVAASGHADDDTAAVYELYRGMRAAAALDD